MTRIQADFLRDPGLQRIMAMLEGAGHQALVVGGAVRNALMGQAVSDVDLASDATPEQVAALAHAAGLRVIPTGIDHGTVTVPSGHAAYEITTFRRDVGTDGRHASVAYSTDLDQDARRRDFTMNALYARADGTVLDPVGGLPDLRARRLRFVGDPKVRIAEDYLRILRFFRFHAWYGTPGEADRQALSAIAELTPGMSRLSRERIGAEMRKLLSAPDPCDALALMAGCGVLAQVLPGADATLLPALITAERRFTKDPDWLLRLAALGGHDPRRDLRLSNAEDHELRTLHQHADTTPLPAAACRLGPRTARRLALLRLARGARLPEDWPEAIARAASARFPLQAADLMPAITGPALGHALSAAKDHWIDHDFRPTREELIALAHEAALGNK